MSFHLVGHLSKYPKTVFLACSGSFWRKIFLQRLRRRKYFQNRPFLSKSGSLFKIFVAFGAEVWITYRFWSRPLGRSPLLLPLFDPWSQSIQAKNWDFGKKSDITFPFLVIERVSRSESLRFREISAKWPRDWILTK